MQSGFRIEGQIGNGRSMREVKNLLEYTADDILNKGISWLTVKSPNADALTRKGDTFDLALKRAKMVMTLAIAEPQMRVAPFTKNQYIEKYIINWYYTTGTNVGNLWRMLILHHVKITKTPILREFMGPDGRNFANTSYYETVMKVESGVEYLNGDGTVPQ